MKKLLIFAVSYIFLSPLAYPFDFKGISIGQPSTPTQVEEKLGVRCGAGASGMQVCNGNVTIARESASMNLVINANGVVRRINLSLSPKSFDIVAPLLIDKFGPPSSTKNDVIQNRMGAKFEQVTHMWTDEDGNIVWYARYAGAIDKSLLSFTSKEERDLLQERRGSRTSDL